MNQNFKNMLRSYAIPIVVYKVIRDYKKTLKYLYKKEGIKSVYRFLSMKLLVADEGGEISLLDPLFRMFPSLIKHPYKLETEVSSVCPRKCVPGNVVVKGDKKDLLVSNINIGDTILSYEKETGKIINSIVKGKIKYPEKKQLYEIETENGEKLKLTGDHLILTSKGWKEAANITEEDEVYVHQTDMKLVKVNSVRKVGAEEVYDIQCEPYRNFIGNNIVIHNCLLCEHTHWKEKDWLLSLEEFKHILNEFPNLKWINMTGEGSAFMNKDYTKMIKHAREKNISVNFVDEFEFIDEKKARELIELGVNSIWISMDGATKETYEKIKVGCDFELALKNIKNFLRIRKELGLPLPYIGFRYIVTTLNKHELPQFVELIHSLGDLGEGSRVEFVGLLTFKEIEYLYTEIPDKVLNETIKRAKELGVRISFAHSSNIPPMKRCTAWAEPYIMMEGYVLPCCAILMANRRPFLREHSFGNIFEQSFDEIWNSDRYKKFRELVPRNTGEVPILCAGCRAYDTSKREKEYGISEEI